MICELFLSYTFKIPDLDDLRSERRLGDFKADTYKVVISTNDISVVGSEDT